MVLVARSVGQAEQVDGTEAAASQDKEGREKGQVASAAGMSSMGPVNGGREGIRCDGVVASMERMHELRIPHVAHESLPRIRLGMRGRMRGMGSRWRVHIR